jgi:dolichyl-phosphate-mannose-protein mannosyltransferase
VSSETADRRQRPVALILLVGLILLAFALRFYRLGAWGFEATEMFTLRDSINPSLSNPRPLVYFLNYWLVRPLMPLDEFGLRVLPALFGVLAIPVFYLVARRLVGTRAALFGALMLAVSGFHVYYSQYARYWTLVFLLSAAYPYAIYLGLRERNRRMLAVGFLTGLLAVLAHPVSVLLVGGLVLWILGTYLRRDQLIRLWGQKAVRWAALVLVVLGVMIAVRYIPLLQNWISERDTGKGGQFLMHIPSTPGVKQLTVLLGFVDTVTIPVVLTGLVGIYLLWQGQDRPLALLLTCLWIFPVAFIFLVSFRTAVSTVYMIPAAPVFFIGTGVFLDRLAGITWDLRPRWLLAATVMAIMIADNAPTLISQYRDGRRYDFRGAAQWLEARRAPEDVVYSDQYQVLQHYLPGTEVQRLRGDPAPLIETARELRDAGRGSALWIVMPGPSHAFRTNPSLGTLKGWLYQNCQLRNTIGVGRLDFRQNLLQIYRCPPELPALAASP